MCKKKYFLWSVLIVLTIGSVQAQVREDTLIHVLPVIGTPEQAIFFKDNFDMEIGAAGYALTSNASEADYLMKLEVEPNLIHYDDGSIEPAPPDEPQFILNVTLISNEEGLEIVSLGFPYYELFDMYEHILFLVYSAMANVPVTKLGSVVEEGDRWRHKWLYLRTTFDYPVVSNHQNNEKSDNFYTNAHGAPIYPHNSISTTAGATMGIELQFLNWMSAELGFLLRFGDTAGDAFLPGVSFQLKFPIKPWRIYMLEPYLMAHTQNNTAKADSRDVFPWWAVGAGFQLGVKGGDSGAFIVDLSLSYTPQELITNYPGDVTWKWTRFVVALCIGYKFGFIDRHAYKSDN